MSGSAIVRSAPGTAVVRTLVPGSVTSADLAEERATEIARANGAYATVAADAAKLVKASNLSDIGNAVTALANLGGVPLARVPERHVAEFGAVGDGTTDDTSAIDAARTWLDANGGGVLRYGPKGKTYKVSAIQLTSGITHSGEGATVKGSSATPEGVFEAHGWHDSSTITDAVVENFIIDEGAAARRAVFLYKATACRVENNRIINPLIGTTDAIRLHFDTTSCVVKDNHITLPVDSPYGTIPAGVGVYCVSSTPDLQGGGQNDTLTFGSSTRLSTQHEISGNRIFNGTHAINLTGATDCRIANNHCEAQTHRSIILSPIALRNTITGNRCKDYGSTAIHMAWGSCFNVITGNNCSSTVSGLEGNAIKGYFGCSDNTVTGNICDGNLKGAIRFAMGSARNNITGNRVIGSGIGVEIQSYLLAADGYYQPATPPDADGNSIHGNLMTGCTKGIQLESNGPASVTNTSMKVNEVHTSTTAYSLSESAGVGSISGVTAIGNTASSYTTAWSLARGERHFLQKSGNTQLIATPQTASLRSGCYYQCTPGVSTSTAATLGNGTFRAAQFRVSHQITLAKIGLEVTSAGDAGCTLRIGIYADDGTGYPKNLVQDCGTVPGDAIAVAEVSTSQVLTPGLYWVGAAVQGVTVTQPTVRSLNAGSTVADGVPLTGGTLPSAGASQPFTFTLSSQTGALASSWSGSASPSSTGLPRIFVKIA